MTPSSPNKPTIIALTAHESLRPELLAPAGDFAALEAALDAGANAVYFGLKDLNARRGAQNFSQDEYRQAVEKVHAAGARAYLTLNTDLAQRELGQAARILEWARRCGTDAVLVRDPALLALRAEFPEIEFHLSTQTCISSRADVEAAARLGAARVVLAREMTLAEIAAASSVPGVKTEVFVQGALCFCVSGRCLLSSWIGGRSGNRGTCTSPCRVPWSIAGEPAGTPLSMRELATVHRLDELRKTGVSALKIEGRLKSASWVAQAVSLYRRALDEPGGEEVLPQAENLTAYAGRELTCGYLDGRRSELTGTAAGRRERPAEQEDAPGPLQCDESSNQAAIELKAETGQDDSSPLEGDVPGYELEILLGGKSIACRCRCGGREDQWTMPKTVVRRAAKAVAVGALMEQLEASPLLGIRLDLGTTDDPEYLLVPRAANALVDRVVGLLRRSQKPPSDLVKVELPETVRTLLEPSSPHAANTRSLGQEPDRVRLDARALSSFLQEVQPSGVIVEGLNAARLEKAVVATGKIPLLVALPPVMFEADLPAATRLLSACKEMGIAVEVNSWGGWRMARKAQVTIEGGPGLAVLNALAAQFLAQKGLRCVTLSLEADRRQLEELTAACSVPCSLVVFGRPALVTTRVDLGEAAAGEIYEDRRGAQMKFRREGGLSVFRPVEPFDLRGQTNRRIRVAHLVVDLVGSSDPVGDWGDLPMSGDERFTFNYDRNLG